MSEKQQSPFSKQCDILAQLWVEYKNDPDFQDFIEYNDLGLPLAYALSTEIIPASPKAEMFVTETWNVFLESLEVTDTGFDSLEDIFAESMK